MTLRTLAQNSFVGIVFEDTGCGMSPEVQKKMFEPFFTTKPVGLGTGLGLSVAFGIIQKHQGRITVESEEGVGTTVTVFLPLDVQPVNSVSVAS